MEQIVFPIPEMCESLTNDTKVWVFYTAERDDQGSKVAAFFEGVDDMFDEMKWQKKLRGQPFLFWVTSHMSIWSQILFNLAVLYCRLLLPIRHWWTRSWSWNSSLRFVSSSCQQKLHLINDLSILSHLGLIWAVMLFSAAVAITLPKPSGIRTLVMTVILRLICSAGPQSTLMLDRQETRDINMAHSSSSTGRAPLGIGRGRGLHHHYESSRPSTIQKRKPNDLGAKGWERTTLRP